MNLIRTVVETHVDRVVFCDNLQSSSSRIEPAHPWRRLDDVLSDISLESGAST
jgi:hypothetical protein